MKEDNVGSIVTVTFNSLNDLLNMMKVKVIDFWSLDTEGSEVSILKTVDFRSVLFGLLFIESNSAEYRRKVTHFMESMGRSLVVVIIPCTGAREKAYFLIVPVRWIYLSYRPREKVKIFPRTGAREKA
jgi:hypothetical protein